MRFVSIDQFTIISFCLVSLFAFATGDDIFDEMEATDFVWPVAELSTTSNITDMGMLIRSVNHYNIY